MHKQTAKLIAFSSIAIVVMTLAWGVNQIPRQKRMAEQTLKASLEQELLVVSSAVRASTQAMRFKLLDVLKAEGGEKSTRAFQDSPFASVTLLEWDTAQWKSLWHSTKFKDRLQMSDLRLWMKDWPLAKISPNEAYFVRVGDVGGVAHFAIVTPVRKSGNSVMMGVGVFPATEFGMSFSADRMRDVKITDDKGYAMALSRPAYLGVSLRKEGLIGAMVDGDEVSTRLDWDSESGRMFGVATRMNDSNLIASIETPVNFGTGYLWQGWVYLVLCAIGASLLNWYLFNTMLGPLLQQITQSDAAIEALKRGIAQNQGAGAAAGDGLARAPGVAPVVESELEDFSFIEPGLGKPTTETAADAATVRMSLGKVIASAVRSQELNIRKYGVRVQTAGVENVMLTADALQLQTALEEVIKNSVEAMAESEQRVLTILGETRKGRVHLTIEDTGCGVEAVNLSKVFDPFFSTKDTEGVSRGLGLNVVRRVIEELKGTVELTSNGQGTCVELEWPDENLVVSGAIENVAPIEESAPVAASDESAHEAIELQEDDDFEAMILSAPLVPSSKRVFSSDLIRKPKVRTLS
jgi:anti-sigma regulatory factor (Ser/Thr protein kinase)